MDMSSANNPSWRRDGKAWRAEGTVHGLLGETALHQLTMMAGNTVAMKSVHSDEDMNASPKVSAMTCDMIAGGTSREVAAAGAAGGASTGSSTAATTGAGAGEGEEGGTCASIAAACADGATPVDVL